MHHFSINCLMLLRPFIHALPLHLTWPLFASCWLPVYFRTRLRSFPCLILSFFLILHVFSLGLLNVLFFHLLTLKMLAWDFTQLKILGLLLVDFQMCLWNRIWPLYSLSAQFYHLLQYLFSPSISILILSTSLITSSIMVHSTTKPCFWQVFGTFDMVKTMPRVNHKGCLLAA